MPKLRNALLAGASLSLLMSSQVAAQDKKTDAPTEATADHDIVVTATRREESQSKVPISITSYTEAAMDIQGIRQIDDLSRLTPSLRFSRAAGVSGQLGANISIRGIASDVGSATTAIYLDDTPIQIRNIAYFTGNPYPRVFDLERVEVLRGPQGTQFGAGAEGGAVRFITPQPNFDQYRVYGRTEIATTKNGAASYEGGAALGGPISDTLAFRASFWERRDGGYIDRYDPTITTLIKKDINSQNTIVARAAISWKPIDGLMITPSIFYQKVKANGRNQYWEAQSDIANQNYKTGIYNPEPSNDRFHLSAVKIRYGTGNISITSNTSYLDRTVDQAIDYATFLSANRTGNPFGVYANKDPYNATATQFLHQTNLTEELRVESVNPTGLFDWSAGIFYSDAKQESSNLSGSGRIAGVISSGYPQYLGRYNLYSHIDAEDEQIAGFANLDIKPAEGLKVTLGGRVTRSSFDFTQIQDGPVNSGVRTTTGFGQKATAFTPKVGVSYQLDRNNLLYATASKGFRPGGAQSPVDPTFCAADLATIGLTASPTSYKSDSLWSYEAGAKNKLLNGHLSLDVNAYLVKWKNIQQAVRLPRCSYDFIENLGNATGKGFDLSVSVFPVPGVSFGANIGLNHTTFDAAVVGGNGVLIRKKGDRIGGPAWTGSLFGEVVEPLGDTVKGYYRTDFSFAGVGIRADPAVFSYDPGLPGLPASNDLSMRVGVRKGGFDLSIFVNNLTNSSDAIVRGHDTIGSPLYYDESYRPRTVGLTGVFRY